jgi:hypothetical protein
MSAILTDAHYLMLELIAGSPLPASREVDRYTARLSAKKLIMLGADARWTITELGKAMLERQSAPLQ